MIKNYLQLMRPQQYIKNFFIFLPQFFALMMFDVPILISEALAFIAFSLVCSSVYILNDVFDINEDRKHPVKQNRPLASGKITRRSGLIFMAILLLAGLIIMFLLSLEAFVLTGVYLVLNIAYSIKLKHIPIVDIAIISAGFLIRLFIGAVFCDITLSMWIVLMTFLLALFLAFAKRRDDVLIFQKTGEKMRKVIDGYNLEFVNVSMMIMASVVIVSYIMYTISPEVLKRYYGDKAYLTVIWVILGVLRYMQITFVQEKSGSPTRLLLKDIFTQAVVLGWIITFGVMMYL